MTPSGTSGLLPVLSGQKSKVKLNGYSNLKTVYFSNFVLLNNFSTSFSELLHRIIQDPQFHRPQIFKNMNLVNRRSHTFISTFSQKFKFITSTFQRFLRQHRRSKRVQKQVQYCVQYVDREISNLHHHHSS